MDRSKEPLAGRPNGRPTSLLVVKESGRKPLFSSNTSRDDSHLRDKDKENDRASLSTSRNRLSLLDSSVLRRTSSIPQLRTIERKASNSSLNSSGGSRIPRPTSMTFSNRKPLSLAEAFSRAGLEDEDESDQSQVMDASPSPAPRVARARREEEDKKMRKILGQDHLDSKAPTRPFSRQSVATSTLADTRLSPEKQDPSRRRSLYGKPRIGLGGDAALDSTSTKVNGLKSDASAEAPAETQPEEAPDRLRPGPRWLKHVPSKDDLTNQGRIPALVPGIEDLPWPSVEKEERRPEAEAQSPAKNASPEKNFAWELDQDFTEGDLQISDSPRIRIGAQPFADRIKFDDGSEVDINSRTRVANPGSRNTKLDEIRSREVKAGSNIPIQSPRRPRNTKLDEIQHREAQAEHQIPIPDRTLPKPTNTKLDEIRQREINGISNRALAKMRLDEIREQNLNTALRPQSPSQSPEQARPQSSRGVYETAIPAPQAKEMPRPKSAFEMAGERIPDTPVTIFKAREYTSRIQPSVEVKASRDKDETVPTRPETSHGRSDSRELLRRLARAASSSPAPETEPQPPISPPKAQEPHVEATELKSAMSRRNSENDARHRSQETTKDRETSKPTVGFTGLPRSHSTDSLKSKRSSMQSEIDPTDRIEGEMKLFAPGETQSEKGSVRAPSPLQELEEEKQPVQATPRQTKPDPLTMPTPRIMGAYVETPATVKVEKMEIKEQKPLEKLREELKEELKEEPKEEFQDDLREQPREQPRHDSNPLRPRSSTSTSTREEKANEDVRRPRTRSATSTREAKVTEVPNPARLRSISANRDRKAERAWQSADTDTTSDPGTDEKFEPTSVSTGVRRRRAHSLPRRRRPLKNTAKLPTVKDDLMQLQRTHNIEDSTLDDIEEVLLGRKTPSPRMKELIKNLPTDPTLDDDLDFDLEFDTKLNTRSNQTGGAKDSDHSDGELAAYSRMSKSLQTGLMGIRTAKKGIERLEDQFAHETKTAEKAATDKLEEKTDTPSQDHTHTPACTTHVKPAKGSYVQLPIPRLYRRKPSFRFTILGILVFVFSLWYAAESTMCAKYCRPASCDGNTCVFSFDDPTFGIAIPVKLDQWTTGGQGRVLVDRIKEEVDDWTADLLDFYHGRDIKAVDVDNLTFEQKRQHRRRMGKKGLLGARQEPSDHQPKWDAWHQARMAKERVQEAREMGYEVEEEDDESIGGDERVW